VRLACSFACGRVRPACRGLRAVICCGLRESRFHEGNLRDPTHLITSAARARLKQHFRFRRAGTGVGTLRILATSCLSCAHKGQHEIRTWHTCPKPWAPGFHLLGRADSRSQMVRLGVCSPCSLQHKHALLLRLLPPPAAVQDRRPTDPINARAIGPPTSKIGVRRFPQTADQFQAGLGARNPACGALVSRQNKTARDTTRQHRIESGRSRWANRDLSRFRGCLRPCTADKAQNQLGESLGGMLRAQAGSIGDHGQETWTKRQQPMSESLRATARNTPKQVSDTRLERLAAERGRASAEAYVLLELREARSAGDRVSAFHSNGRYTIRSVSQ
jgi:hypothetical protein